MSIVPYLYVPQRRSNAQRKGWAESTLKRRLQRQGWTVWRGGYLHATRKDELYPNVLSAYSRLAALLEQHRAGTLEMLQYFCVVHHGMPDFICYRQGQFKFVECKLEHEQLQESQKRCIPRLLAMGFPVEVHKLVNGSTKSRYALVDIETGEKRVAERQTTLASFRTGQRRRRAVRAGSAEAGSIPGGEATVAVH